ncbi:MAG: phage portal protein [Methanobacterium paludis]|nr:phage portal protein [Methanobacterium paludis]
MQTLNSLQGVFEVSDSDSWDKKSDVEAVLDDNIAKTCLHILVSLVNQNLTVSSKKAQITKAFKKFMRSAKFKKQMDSIVFNQIGYGYAVLYFDVTKDKVMVYDSSTLDLVIDTKIDEFLGVYQRAQWCDPEQQKKGMQTSEMVEGFIDVNLGLLLVPGIGKGSGESLLVPAYPYVKAKHELVDSLYELVQRLGLLTVIGVDLPGEVGSEDLDEYLTEVEQMVLNSASNTTWILPKETEVQGVRGSGEARIIESVKTLIDMLDEEIRKCLFVPDTFMTSLSANRATAKEQRYLISSMVDHIRDLIEEALYPLFDSILKYEGLSGDYEFTWGNINLPEPEILATFLQNLLFNNTISDDEIRGWLNMGQLPKELKTLKKEQRDQQKQQNIYQMMGYGQNNQQDKGGGDNGSGRKVQPGQKTP